MRKIILLIAIICYATSATAQKKVSVLGDSYSTFEGFMTPSCNLSWYAGEDGKGKRNDVSRVEETWWHLLIKKQGWTLEANNSYSGATICFTGYRGDKSRTVTGTARIHRRVLEPLGPLRTLFRRVWRFFHCKHFLSAVLSALNFL